MSLNTLKASWESKGSPGKNGAFVADFGVVIIFQMKLSQNKHIFYNRALTSHAGSVKSNEINEHR